MPRPKRPLTRCRECGTSYRYQGRPGWECCPVCHLCQDQQGPEVLTWEGPSPTIADTRQLARELAENDRPAPADCDPERSVILTADYAHPATRRLIDAAARCGLGDTFGPKLIERILRRLHVLTGKDTTAIDQMTEDEAADVLLRDWRDGQRQVTGDKGDDTARPPPADGCRLQIEGRSVYVDGALVPLDMTSERADDALAYLGELKTDPGEWKSDPDVGRATRREKVRFDRIRAVLPKPIGSLIETHHRKGSRLRPACWRK
jgi:hypothetical protein